MPTEEKIIIKLPWIPWDSGSKEVPIRMPLENVTKTEVVSQKQVCSVLEGDFILKRQKTFTIAFLSRSVILPGGSRCKGWIRHSEDEGTVPVGTGLQSAISPPGQGGLEMGEGGSETGLGAKLRADLLEAAFYGWGLNRCCVESLTDIRVGATRDMGGLHTSQENYFVWKGTRILYTLMTNIQD